MCCCHTRAATGAQRLDGGSASGQRELTALFQLWRNLPTAS
jgi:hypothetical protein